MSRQSKIALFASLLTLIIGLVCAAQDQVVGRPQAQPEAEVGTKAGHGAVPAVQAAGTFRNPLNTGADPFLTYANGAYHLTTTQNDSIKMWSSPSLGTLLDADPVTVWRDTDPTRNQHIWAAEFYRFGNRKRTKK